MWLHNERMKLERALFDAAKGDYRGIKVALVEKWRYEAENSYWSHQARVFMRMVEITPDNAAPFIPPSPAWVDFDDLE